MSQKIVQMVKPSVPANLGGIKGTVSLEVAIGMDGRVIKAVPTGGPTELYAISVGAVEQWVYQPTLINGNPVVVITVVDIKYQ
jgi:protein TonB